MKPKWGDFVLTAIVILLSLMFSYKILFNKSDSAPMAIISMDGQRVQEIVLYPDLEHQIVRLKDGKVLIEAENGKIRFLESDCANQICVNTGWISSPGQIAACLPNKALIKIESDADELDVVVQ